MASGKLVLSLSNHSMHNKCLLAHMEPILRFQIGFSFVAKFTTVFQGAKICYWNEHRLFGKFRCQLQNLATKALHFDFGKKIRIK